MTKIKGTMHVMTSGLLQTLFPVEIITSTNIGHSTGGSVLTEQEKTEILNKVTLAESAATLASLSLTKVENMLDSIPDGLSVSVLVALNTLTLNELAPKVNALDNLEGNAYIGDKLNSDVTIVSFENYASKDIYFACRNNVSIKIYGITFYVMSAHPTMSFIEVYSIIGMSKQLLGAVRQIPASHDGPITVWFDEPFETIPDGSKQICCSWNYTNVRAETGPEPTNYIQYYTYEGEYHDKIENVGTTAPIAVPVLRITALKELNDKKLDDAPEDDTIYGRKNGKWVKAADASLQEKVAAIELELNGVLNDLMSI